MKKVFILSVILSIFCIISISAQSADKLTEMIETDQATWGQMCYFASTYLDLQNDFATEELCIQSLYDQKVITKIYSPDTPICLKDVAFICTNVWNVKSSLLYKITHAPRYAFRQLKADGLIQQNADPSQICTGHQSLDLFTSCMSFYGKEKEAQ